MEISLPFVNIIDFIILLENVDFIWRIIKQGNDI